MKFYISKKQRAIMNEVSNFYAQTGSSWKNMLSFGDSDFERYAMQASLEDYAAFREDGGRGPVMGTAVNKSAVLKCKKDGGDQLAVSGFVGQHYRRCRCKTVKMFEAPTIEDLCTQMAMLSRWIPHLVKRDGGFDVDLEDQPALYKAHFDLTGETLQ